jgi:hypothetical protein
MGQAKMTEELARNVTLGYLEDHLVWAEKEDPMNANAIGDTINSIIRHTGPTSQKVVINRVPDRYCGSPQSHEAHVYLDEGEGTCPGKETIQPTRTPSVSTIRVVKSEEIFVMP